MSIMAYSQKQLSIVTEMPDSGNSQNSGFFIEQNQTSFYLGSAQMRLIFKFIFRLNVIRTNSLRKTWGGGGGGSTGFLTNRTAKHARLSARPLLPAPLFRQVRRKVDQKQPAEFLGEIPRGETVSRIPYIIHPIPHNTSRRHRYLHTVM